MSSSVPPLPAVTPPPIGHGAHGHGHRVRTEQQRSAFVDRLSVPVEDLRDEAKAEEVSDALDSHATIDGGGARAAEHPVSSLAAGETVSGMPLVPLVDAVDEGPVPLEHFSSDYGVDPGGGVTHLHAIVTKGAQLVAVIDRAGNVFVRRPAGDAVREAMWTLSSPIDRTEALAGLYDAVVAAGAHFSDLSAALRALAGGAAAARI